MKKPDFKYVKKRIHELCGIGDEIHFLYVDKKRQEKELEEECSKLLGLKALDALEHVSVEELKNSKAGIRVAVLQEAGYDNLLQLAKLKDWELVSIDGIGEKQAQAIRNVIAEFLNSMAKHVHITFSLGKTEDGEIPNAELLLAIAKLKKCNHVREEAEGLEEVLDANFNDAVEHIEIQSGMHWLVSSRDAKERTVKAVQDLESFMLGKDCTRAKALIQLYHEMTNLTIEQALGFYQAESADFYALLEKYGGTAKENPLIYSSIPAQLAAAIEESPIDLRYFKGNLRAYQLFGAKYILFERRVLLGDEMGLGKTVQAIAAMCDVYAQDPLSRFLVICPASVFINWCREIKKFSAMEAWLIHGACR
jgi:hypothetical protein